jgi:hypothetical protein
MTQDPKMKKKLDEFINLNSANRIKEFLFELFLINHKIKEGKNPLAGFLIEFDSAGLEGLAREVKASLKSLGREYILIDANGKTFIECINQSTGENYRVLHDAFEGLKEILLNSDKVIIFKEFSKCKLPTNKGSMVRSIIKIRDNANSDGPLSDLLFIDYAEFLQKSWKHVCPYIKVTT